MTPTCMVRCWLTLAVMATHAVNAVHLHLQKITFVAIETSDGVVRPFVNGTLVDRANDRPIRIQAHVRRHALWRNRFASVTFIVDGQLAAIDSQPPYIYTYTLNQTARGPHTLRLDVYRRRRARGKVIGTRTIDFVVTDVTQAPIATAPIRAPATAPIRAPAVVPPLPVPRGVALPPVFPPALGPVAAPPLAAPVLRGPTASAPVVAPLAPTVAPTTEVAPPLAPTVAPVSLVAGPVAAAPVGAPLSTNR